LTFYAPMQKPIFRQSDTVTSHITMRSFAPEGQLAIPDIPAMFRRWMLFLTAVVAIESNRKVCLAVPGPGQSPGGGPMATTSSPW
jgi:hypothetical protein